jgi:hypothetical protein
MSFEDLKKRSKSGSLTEKLLKKVEKMSEGNSNDDERFWKPSLGKTGTGQAVLRFLPAKIGQWEEEYVELFTHAFQGPGGQWLIDNCPTTIGKQCPVCSNNREDWNTGNKDTQNLVRERKRKLSYYSNIYIIKDYANPENDGKVKIFKYGKKIFEKIEAALNPKFEGDPKIDAFSLWDGADFNLKICKVDGYWNYDKSEFSKPSEFLSGDDEQLKRVYESLHNITDFVNPEKFKSYDDLKNRLDLVLGLRGDARRRVDPDLQEEVQDDYDKFIETKSKTSPSSALGNTEDEDEDADEALNYFEKLASM